MLTVIQWSFGVFAVLFGLAVVLVPISLWGEPDVSVSMLVFMALFYFLFAWGFYVSYSRVRRWRKSANTAA